MVKMFCSKSQGKKYSYDLNSHVLSRLVGSGGGRVLMMDKPGIGVSKPQSMQEAVRASQQYEIGY